MRTRCNPWRAFAGAGKVSAILLMLGVLLIFFCPLPTGSFQATHGPTTAMRSLRAALMILLAMAAVAGLPLPMRITSLFLNFFLATLRRQTDSDILVVVEDPVRITCELLC